MVLRALVATCQEKHDLRPSLGVVDAVAWADINPQFPYAISAKPMIAEVALFHTVYALHDLHLRDGITNPSQPFEKNILAIWSQIVANFE